MEKDMIKSYLQEVLGLIDNGRVVRAHQRLTFVINNLGGNKLGCRHDWEKFCNKPGCVQEYCEEHKGRLCIRCKIDKHDVISESDVE